MTQCLTIEFYRSIVGIDRVRSREIFRLTIKGKNLQASGRKEPDLFPHVRVDAAIDFGCDGRIDSFNDLSVMTGVQIELNGRLRALRFKCCLKLRCPWQLLVQNKGEKHWMPEGRR